MSGALTARMSGFARLQPDAVNWNNISGTHAARRTNASQTISGNTQPITVKITYVDILYFLDYVKNGAGPVAISSGDTVSLASGDTLSFGASWNNVDMPTGSLVTVTNSTTGGTLDTFTVTLT